MSPKDLGILFRDDMVRAILADQKRVDRRAIRINPADGAFYLLGGWPHRSLDGESNRVPGMEEPYPCRYSVGRRLWVRETWRPWVRGWSTHVQYRADGERGPSLGAAESDACMAVAEKNGGHWDDGRCQNPDTVKWRPSLHMPRWASRLTLRVTDVRAERLTEIADEDVALEGFEHAGLGTTAACYVREYREMHGLPDDADPWLWRIAFEVVDA